ncbi:hypothetical protein MPC4_100038 [Methylocella tundrae]|uniref:Uncharacterized protein n=1 Tax=Methylocella tundrae TaxID=227605 RepID=A0A8B6M1I0_METTU|nr:hypothetical protein MPC1_950004 [Methylocella tundrae]VTZ48595.1 hypothetical protein MPC4_100038 [Methylocella tundrae]
MRSLTAKDKRLIRWGPDVAHAVFQTLSSAHPFGSALLNRKGATSRTPGALPTA